MLWHPLLVKLGTLYWRVIEVSRFVLIEGRRCSGGSVCDPTFSSWGFGGAVSPQRGPGSAFWQPSMENWLKIRSLGRRRHPNYSNFLENIISSSMYDTTSSGVLI